MKNSAYPADEPITIDFVIQHCHDFLKGDVKKSKGSMGDIVNTEIIKRIEKQIGTLVNVDNFNLEIYEEGYDTVLLVFGSHNTE